jgi:hypothetical protein
VTQTTTNHLPHRRHQLRKRLPLRALFSGNPPSKSPLQRSLYRPSKRTAAEARPFRKPHWSCLVAVRRIALRSVVAAQSCNHAYANNRSLRLLLRVSRRRGMRPRSGFLPRHLRRRHMAYRARPLSLPSPSELRPWRRNSGNQPHPRRRRI